MGLAAQLLHPEPRFFILSMYAVGLSAVVGANVVVTHFPQAKLEMGEFYLPGPRPLPMGTFVRFS